MQKKITLFHVLMFIILSTFGIIDASAESYNNLTYTISDEKITITDCVETATNVKIPAEIDGYPVTDIGKEAFYGCRSLENITVPDSVTSIGEGAFKYCTNLKNITLSNNLTSIGAYTFFSCESLESITIPEKVTIIDFGLFEKCTSLKSVKIPNSVTTIAEYAFFNCYNLTTITIPDSVISIGVYAFENCITLTSITLSNNITNIAEGTFSNCVSLKSIIIPDKVTSIGMCAFEHCINLRSAKISDNVTSIGEEAFFNCYNLTHIVLPKGVQIDYRAFFQVFVEVLFFRGDEDDWYEILENSEDDEELEYARIIFNATPKTYKFQTNCNASLPEITTHFIMSEPSLENKDKLFLGWYDNEALTGTKITFPYYGNATTLYAAWIDKTGSSFEDALFSEENAKYEITTVVSNQIVYYEYTPRFTGTYRFYSTGSIDTHGYLYDSNQNLLTSADSGAVGQNFFISYNLTAGEKYYIAIKCCSNPGTFTFVTNTDCVESTSTICATSETGEKIFVCTPNYLPLDCQIILALYKNDNLVQIQYASNKNKNIYFVVTESFDLAKVMVWKSLENQKPVCDIEIVE